MATHPNGQATALTNPHRKPDIGVAIFLNTLKLRDDSGFRFVVSLGQFVTRNKGIQEKKIELFSRKMNTKPIFEHAPSTVK
ncbi:MAG: hypothetical protein WBA28_06755 [Microbacteriaceae bacterium]